MGDPFVDTGVLYRGDNETLLAEFPDECVDLIYLDPPFFSNRIYEVIWGDEAEIRSFEDRWAGSILTYVDWMKRRIPEMRRVLKSTGSFYLHCDPHASHYLKVLLDEVFGGSMFRNEITWQRTAAKGDARRKFGAVHDSILFYTKSNSYLFNPQYYDQDDAYLGRFTLDDHDGRGAYRLAPLDSPNPRPNLTYEYKGYEPPTKGWRVSRAVMEQLDAEGRLAFPRKKSGRVARKHYLAEQAGRKVADVWTDIGPLQAASAERRGYPTQKPEPLLARIIQASSREGDIVLDPFCGCGTSIVVAERLRRQWIGMDISPTAIEIMKRRMIIETRHGWRAEGHIFGAPETLDDLRALKPLEFQNWIINAMNGTHAPRTSGDMGIDGYSFLEQYPIQVKQMDHVGRPEVDKFETAVRRDGKDTGYIVAFNFTRGVHDEVARAKADGINVKLLKVAEVLLLARRPGNVARKFGPQPDEPLIPPMRKPSELPTAKELIASNQSHATAS